MILLDNSPDGASARLTRVDDSKSYRMCSLDDVLDQPEGREGGE